MPISETGSRIWRWIRENSAKLKGCAKPHRFVRLEDQKHRCRCETCGGEVGIIEAGYYDEGLADGRVEGMNINGKPSV